MNPRDPPGPGLWQCGVAQFSWGGRARGLVVCVACAHLVPSWAVCMTWGSRGWESGLCCRLASICQWQRGERQLCLELITLSCAEVLRCAPWQSQELVQGISDRAAATVAGSCLQIQAGGRQGAGRGNQKLWERESHPLRGMYDPEGLYHGVGLLRRWTPSERC